MSNTFNGFLLAKDSLIKSSHASHPIAGQGAAKKWTKVWRLHFFSPPCISWLAFSNRKLVIKGANIR